MKTHTHSLEIHLDFDRDPESRKLERLLAAESAHAHAVARRSFLAYVCALLGIPLWFFAAGIGPFAIREAGLLLFPVFMAGFLVSLVAERVWSRRAARAESGIRVRRKAL